MEDEKLVMEIVFAIEKAERAGVIPYSPKDHEQYQPWWDKHAAPIAAEVEAKFKAGQ